MKSTKEPAAVRELHRIRQDMLAEETRVGRDKFWAETNRQGKQFARCKGRLKSAAGGAPKVQHPVAA
jgi:hypothetical protein